ncbi:MAG: hypothetical protein S4CHLAM102_11290 [Chlamydiia bacterium]|nr:hypothetical protein [Chlamydiia bacterium]
MDDLGEAGARGTLDDVDEDGFDVESAEGDFVGGKEDV